MLSHSNTLDQVIQSVYQASVKDESHIRTVKMGPFEVKDDAGLPSRRSAFECMANILETTRSFDMNVFIDHLLTGLSDDNDIKALVFVTFKRMISLAPTQLAKRNLSSSLSVYPF